MGGSVTDQHQQERQTESAIKVRQVTDYQADVEARTVGAGAEEYVIRPTAGDAKVIRKLLDKSDALVFDLGRRVLIARDLPVGD